MKATIDYMGKTVMAVPLCLNFQQYFTLFFILEIYLRPLQN